ncbi:unnamed protein product, partial [Prorocentrum cordatum]
EKKEELSEEDRQKKEELELLAQRAQDPDEGVAKLALTTIVTELKTATSSMTSVPKPLKFLRPHYAALTEHYEKMNNPSLKPFFADVLSVLATTMQKEGSRQSLKYRLEGTKEGKERLLANLVCLLLVPLTSFGPTLPPPARGFSFEGLTSWGHEYIRNISGEISEEFKERTEKGADVKELLDLVEEIVPFNMKHNAEVDAIDLLCEVDKVVKIEQLCEEATFGRVCLYLQGLSNFAATQADKVVYLKVCCNLYVKFKEYPNALRIALKLNDSKLVTDVFASCEDKLVKKQMAFLISRRKFNHEFEDDDDDLKE